MILTSRFNRCAVVAALSWVTPHLASVVSARSDSRPDVGSKSTTTIAEALGEDRGEVSGGVAAIIDGHAIPLDEVILACLRLDRSYVIDQMIQDYVIHRECQRQGIGASESEIDQRVAGLRKDLAPATVEETLKVNRMTMPELRSIFRQDIERAALVAGQVKPVKLVHCREIFVAFAITGDPGKKRTEAEALALAMELREQIKRGADFDALAARYFENKGSAEKRDLGVLYANAMGLDAPVLEAAMLLAKGEVSSPVKTADGYHLIQAMSTEAEHAAENALFQEATDAARHQQIQFLTPAVIVALIEKAKITHLKDSELKGTPWPRAAATVDDHEIPMQDVITKCLSVAGRKRLNVLLQNYVVDRECERRGYTVSEAEIDQRVADLRQQIAPMTLTEGLELHHTTLEGLRRDFRQQIKRTQLASDRVKPPRLVHARIIFVEATLPGEASMASGIQRTEGEAKARLVGVRSQWEAGRSFEMLAAQYSERGDKTHGGDLGIIYEGQRDLDTAILTTALAMKQGEVVSEIVKTRDGYFILQVISTGENHPGNEEAAYTQAFANYREEKAQSLIPQAIMELIDKSKVVYHLDQ